MSTRCELIVLKCPQSLTSSREQYKQIISRIEKMIKINKMIMVKSITVKQYGFCHLRHIHSHATSMLLNLAECG